MLSCFIRRLLLAALTLVLVTFVVYALIRNMPGTLLTIEKSEDPSARLPPEERLRMQRKYFLDRPWYVGYWLWLVRVVRELSALTGTSE